MMLRPLSAIWFEILAAREDVPRLLEAIARTAAVELEAHPERARPAAADPGLASALREYAELKRRYAPYWPAAVYAPSSTELPATDLAHCLVGLRAWAAEAEIHVRELQRIEREREELRVWQGFLGALEERGFDPGGLADAGPLFAACLLVFPDDRIPAMPPQLLTVRADLGGKPHVLVVGPAAEVQSAIHQAAAFRAQAHAVPAWLHGTRKESLERAAARLTTLDVEADAHRSHLDALHAKHGIARRLGELSCLEWCAQHAAALDSGELFTWITGWTSDRTALVRIVEASGARALVHFPPAPEKLEPPMLLRNPRWLRPFEVFSRALGLPARHEADPTPVLAIAVPLLFGYMFGDVGQGLVLAAAGLLLARRWEIARLLVAGGLSAAFFGMLFGSVFAREDVLSALWLHPLDEPLAVIAVPLGGGVLLLTLGLGLNAAEHYWRGEWRKWLATEAGFIATYLGIVSAPLEPRALLVAAAGCAWHVAGCAWHAGRLRAAFGAALMLVEKTAQILINTLSFVRVGAFALAHAGLSSAVVALASTADNPAARAFVLMIGNAVIIVLEAMVVSIQTTRLVLFEFFMRFMFGSGRTFRPLPPPPFASQET